MSSLVYSVRLNYAFRTGALTGIAGNRPVYSFAYTTPAHVLEWAKQQETRSGACTLFDYCFDVPDKSGAPGRGLPPSMRDGRLTDVRSSASACDAPALHLPLLTELVGELEASIPAGELNSILRRTGKRLAVGLASGRRAAGDLRARVTKASKLMNTHLGAHTHVERNGHYVIRGVSCPLAALTSQHPAVCLAVRSWLTEVVGAPVHECCERAPQPRCRFEIRQR